MKQTFYSNGKLLITGEYLVLDGAQALALPTKFGQNLVVEEGLPNTFEWVSYDSDGSIWFESVFSFDDVFNKKKYIDNKIQTTLIEILHHAYLLNEKLLQSNFGYKVSTKLTFPKFWGLGTSSTLINNIAQWLSIDAYTLLIKSFGGSGYDVACAQYNTPILYQLIKGEPDVIPVDFYPNFTNQLYFVYLNQKQNSRTAIANYYKKSGNIQEVMSTVNKLTQEVLKTNRVEEFSQLLELHEKEMSKILETQTVQEILFSDFGGIVKSLGAWGGDFVLVISKENPSSYFLDKGYSVVLSYQDMIL
ncbi:GYDIA family GHMP kinase [Flavobacterium oreochromis]|uniref:GYDIA family GHMP kinase n=1 Tax=Flavobacterium oreochromis TaxID=2906078 RepID=A0ABW8PAY6_9FLAO|nr:GYDIA family GHMP kinase [Flavobacterium oreochromis]OWP75710.1 GHMP kinase [Flavobacterium oreochromis]POR27273.1 GHMP kinase [Flavobacterium columnare]